MVISSHDLYKDTYRRSNMGNLHMRKLVRNNDQTPVFPLWNHLEREHSTHLCPLFAKVGDGLTLFSEGILSCDLFINVYITTNAVHFTDLGFEIVIYVIIELSS